MTRTYNPNEVREVEGAKHQHRDLHFKHKVKKGRDTWEAKDRKRASDTYEPWNRPWMRKGPR